MFQISCSSNLNTIYNNSNEILTSIQNTNSTRKKNKSNSKKKKFNFQYFKHRKKLNSMKSFRCLSTSASPKNKKNISNHSIYSNENNNSRINSIRSEDKINDDKFLSFHKINKNKISVKKNFFNKDKIIEKFSFIIDDEGKKKKNKN